MPHDRYFLPVDFSQEKNLTLSGNEFHHLVHVMRKKVGDSVELINGKNTLAKALISHLHSQQATLIITSLFTQTTNSLPLFLALSWISPAKLDWVIEKGCELGVTDFFLFSSEWSAPSHHPETRRERMHSILISSIKQCGRLDLPTIFFGKDLSFLSSLPAHFFFGDTRKEAPFLHKRIPLSCTGLPFCFVIGPEKGFSANDLLFLEQSLHATGVRLHTHTLRSETAAIAALALLAHPLN